MLRRMPQRMAGSMPEVVKALVAKLGSAESSLCNGSSAGDALELMRGTQKLSAPDAQVVSTMLRRMPQRMAGSMPEVVKALVAKLGSAESSPLITSLLVVLAQLVHANARQLLDFLAAQPAPGTLPAPLHHVQACMLWLFAPLNLRQMVKKCKIESRPCT